MKRVENSEGEGANLTPPSGDTRAESSSGIEATRTGICPHCGSAARHTDRIGCCSGCGRLFTSLSSFERHRRKLQCVDPAEVGLEPKVVKSDPSVPAWGWPAPAQGVGSW